MATQTVRLGWAATLTFDDEKYDALNTTGVLRASGVPTDPNHLVRLVDIIGPSDENFRYHFMMSVC